MMNPQNATLSAFTLACALLVGCGEQDEPRAENTGERAEALTEEVEAARSQPSGDVAQGTIAGVLGAYAEIDYAIGDMGMPCDLDPFAFGDAADCSIDTDGSDVDVSCLSSGTASGTTSVDVHISGGDTFVHYAFDDVCAADRDVCVTGEGAVKVSSSGEVIVAGELVTTRGGATSAIKYGVTVAPLGGVEVVLWHDGESFVVNAGGAGVDIEGANGGFDCDLVGELDDFSAAIEGSCSGAAEFEF